MANILLVEDDPILGNSLQVFMKLKGYEVEWARDLRSAQAINREKPCDLVILDLGLPDGSGLSFCRQLREEGSRIPILILTAKTQEEDVVEGLNAGANDYIRKPFGNNELAARIRTALREPLLRDDQLRVGDLVIFPGQRKVQWQQNTVDLRRKEFDIFYLMAQNCGSVITRERLLQAIDSEGAILDRTLDSHLSHIRQSLKKAGVTSVRLSAVYGVGYKLETR
ncbi:MAG: response regulator transcription factor [Bdellovibrionaceae bacterium]|nr:response regulator transcription factor [Pseudobdellovibrionaceae bacterium]MBX3034891.1 response regulator transcription factor [Pseudobdellovibrionaceae bacterium]